MHMDDLQAKIRYPTLSFPELQSWAKLVAREVCGSRIERVFVPATPEHPELYFKNEWVLDLRQTHSSLSLYLSIRPQAAGFAVYPLKQLKPETSGSRSGFDLSLHKHLVGGKIIHVRALPGERIVVIEIQGSEQFELHLHFIPAKPLGALLKRVGDELELLSASDQREHYELPATRELTPEQLLKIPNRPELTTSISHYRELWQIAQKNAALALRKQKLEQKLQAQLQAVESKMKSLSEQLRSTEAEPDWNYFGSLLQTHFHAKPKAVNGFFELEDYEKEIQIKVPADPKLGLKNQLEKFFHSAKRKKKREEETAIRKASLQEKKDQLTDKLLKVAQSHDLSELLELEPKREILKGKEHKKLAEFTGKQYKSKEGLTLLAGRNSAENLELTFKIARGNDLWFHVKGRPGSHTVVVLPPQKSASLDTLLDAAHLCILHSGGKDWGKTEVDYTYRKYVKKIKNQTEVSYTHNKTLMVSPEPERLIRLYGSD